MFNKNVALRSSRRSHPRHQRRLGVAPRLAILALLSAAEIAPAATGLPFIGSFETGNFSEWDGGRTATLSVSNSSSCDGQYNALSQMSRGTTTDNYQDFYFGDHRQVGGEPATGGLWLQLCSKFSSDFDFGASNLHKIAIINFTDANGLRRYQIILNVWVGTERYFVENLRWNSDGSFGGTVGGYNQNLANPVSIRRGEWDRIKLFIRPNTPGSSDGIIRLWVNGVQKMEYTNVAMREASTFNPNKLIMANYVPQSDVSGIQQWDDFYLGESDPDTAISPPLPPVLRTE
ncbi:MAG: heparin lyase I family protein [Pseudomonadota bacterium]